MLGRLERVREALAASPRSSMRLRLVEAADADFICGLRADQAVNRFISATSPGVDQQRDWIKQYKQREAKGTEFYFLISYREQSCGTARITELIAGEGSCFELGSFVLRRLAPDVAIFAYMAVLSIGFDVLAYERSHFRIFARNNRARDAVEHIGAIVTRREADEVLYDYPFSAYQAFRQKFAPRLDRLSGRGAAIASADPSG